MAASLETKTSAHLGWVGVYPLDLEKIGTREFLINQGIEIFPLMGRAYRLRTFEVNRNLMEIEATIGETELENKTSIIVFSDEELLAELERLDIAIERLELPYKSNYPI